MLFYTSGREGYTQCILYIHRYTSSRAKQDITQKQEQSTVEI